MNKQKMLGATALFAIALSAVSTLAQATQGLIVDRQITSTNFADNKIGVGPVRKMVIFLPRGNSNRTGAGRISPGRRTLNRP